jgi:HD-GYP domain-containing protein (c-di-GMP phosphodiesterase class II)
LIENIANKIAKTMNVQLCSVRLLGEDNKLNSVAAAGVFKDNINTAPIEINTAEFKAAMLNDEKKTFLHLCRQFTLEHNKSNLIASTIEDTQFIPLLLNQEPIGILSIFCIDAFDEEYLDMLESIANNLAFAIEKADLYTRLKQYYLKTIMTLVAAIEAKDAYIQGHSIRVSQFAVKIAEELDMTREEVEEIEIAGILHDIGKIGISDKLLTKPGILEPHEFDIIMEHPVIGCRILEPIG